MATGRRTARGGKTTITPETGIDSDFSDVEEREEGAIYDGPPPTPGLYKGKLTSVGKHTTTDDAVVWTFDITEGKYDGWRGWVYTNNSTAKWKQQDILVALGLCEKQGKFKGSYEEIMRKGGPVRLRVIAEPYQGETTAKIRTVLAPAEAADDAPEDDDPDFQDEPDEKPTRARGRRAKADPEPEPDPEPEGDDEGDDEGFDLDALEEELGELEKPELLAKAKEFGLWKTRAEKKKFEAMDEDALTDAILDAAEEQDPEF